MLFAPIAADSETKHSIYSIINNVTEADVRFKKNIKLLITFHPQWEDA
jgi:hypothetical protein